MEYSVIVFILLFSSVMGTVPGSRIVDGELTTIESYPFMASLLKKMDLNGQFFQHCGGGIVSTKAIISAAHCFFDFNGNPMDPSYWRARAGSSYAQSGGTVYEVERIVLHDFDRDTGENDLAIVRTKKEIKLVPGLVAIMSVASDTYQAPTGQMVSIVGWGRTEYYEAPASQLHHAQLIVLDNERCVEAFGDDPRYPPLSDTMMCAGDNSYAVCSGDSGSPVIHDKTGVGVVSWSDVRCNTSYPAVFTKLSSHLTWIQLVTAD